MKSNERKLLEKYLPVTFEGQKQMTFHDPTRRMRLEVKRDHRLTGRDVIDELSWVLYQLRTRSVQNWQFYEPIVRDWYYAAVSMLMLGNVPARLKNKQK